LTETVDNPKFALERMVDLKTTKCHAVCAAKGMGFVPLARKSILRFLEVDENDFLAQANFL
jgi:hypothetical protein